MRVGADADAPWLRVLGERVGEGRLRLRLRGIEGLCLGFGSLRVASGGAVQAGGEGGPPLERGKAWNSHGGRRHHGHRIWHYVVRL